MIFGILLVPTTVKHVGNPLPRGSVQFLLKIPPVIKNSPLINNKISDEKNLKISNVLKRPKMRFLAPKAPIFWGDPEIIKNPPLIDHRSELRGEFLKEIVLILFTQSKLRSPKLSIKSVSHAAGQI